MGAFLVTIVDVDEAFSSASVVDVGEAFVVDVPRAVRAKGAVCGDEVAPIGISLSGFGCKPWSVMVVQTSAPRWAVDVDVLVGVVRRRGGLVEPDGCGERGFVDG